MYHFTKKKFLNLPYRTQQTKCAELLRQLYEKILNDQDIQSEKICYEELCIWMKQDLLTEINPKLISDRYHQHLQQAHIAKKEHGLLTQIRKKDRLTALEPWPFHVYLDHIRSAHNVGSILRTVEAFAFGTIYFSPNTPFIDHKQVQDASMGAHAWTICKQGISLTNVTKPLVVLETSQAAMPLDEFIFPETFTIVVGNEEYGCSDEALELADYLVEIPLRGKKNSLNVANAFAIVAGEIQRQKRLKDKYQYEKENKSS